MIIKLLLMLSLLNKVSSKLHSFATLNKSYHSIIQSTIFSPRLNSSRLGRLQEQLQTASTSMSSVASNQEDGRGITECVTQSNDVDDQCQDMSASVDGSSNVKSWQSMLDVSIRKSRKTRGGNYVQIATVDSNGSPRCRTVVFRGLLKIASDSSELVAMKMITDARSEKVAQINNHSAACEMVWWFGQSSEQYRFAGNLSLVSSLTSDAQLLRARLDQWKNLTDPAREQFYWEPPGKSFSGSPTVPLGGRNNEGNILPPPENFLLMLLTPREVKFLRLKDNFALSHSYDSEAKSWISTRVNP